MVPQRVLGMVGLNAVIWSVDSTVDLSGPVEGRLFLKRGRCVSSKNWNTYKQYNSICSDSYRGRVVGVQAIQSCSVYVVKYCY